MTDTAPDSGPPTAEQSTKSAPAVTAGSADVAPYDALLLVSFGGPEAAEDVLPFLENVTRGRGVPSARLTEVAGHYLAFGGVSPINAQTRALVAAVREDLGARGIDLPVYLGNRNWTPYLTDTVRRMADDGVRRAAVFVTSPYASYSGCRQYRENLADALEPLGERAPRLDKLRHYFNCAGFVEPMVRTTLAARARLPEASRVGAHLVFVTHSLPTAQAATSGPAGDAYVAQHLDSATQVVAGVAAATGSPAAGWRLAYSSRSGPPTQPWLEPDVNDALRELAAAGVPGVVLVPIGFVSDHMEVVYDLDTEALRLADRLGLPAARAATVGVDPAFVGLVCELLLERAAAERGDCPPRPAGGALGPSWDACPPGCCPNPRGPRPAACAAAGGTTTAHPGRPTCSAAAARPAHAGRPTDSAAAARPAPQATARRGS